MDSKTIPQETYMKTWRLHEDFFKEINTFIQRGLIKLMKSYSNGIYNVTKGFYFK